MQILHKPKKYAFPNRFLTLCDALRDLVPIAQFKKSEKQSYRSVAVSKVLLFFIRIRLKSVKYTYA